MVCHHRERLLTPEESIETIVFSNRVKSAIMGGRSTEPSMIRTLAVALLGAALFTTSASATETLSPAAEAFARTCISAAKAPGLDQKKVPAMCACIALAHQAQNASSDDWTILDRIYTGQAIPGSDEATMLADYDHDVAGQCVQNPAWRLKR